ncbi:MAG: hypothetical protein LBP19_00185 [Treponema sp.]|jgi:hypothetical protein|nr:hypothetical protein [Treponema sp.]
MHVKTSSIIAGGSFLLSFLVGLIGGAGFPMILVRALVFALLSFVLSEIIHLVTERFLINAPTAMPEDIPPAGSYVNISVTSDVDTKSSETTEITGAQVDIIETAKTEKTGEVPVGTSADDLRSVSLPASGLLDRETKSGYTNTMDSGQNSLATYLSSDELAELSTNTAMPVQDGKLPDMENMADAFIEKEEEESFTSPSRRRSGKTTGVLENYDPAKLAGAIRTILQKK